MTPPDARAGARTDARDPASDRLIRYGGGLIAVLLLGSAVLAAADPGIMTAATAVLLGLVEGLTEWLPISSTGHLTVTQRLLGLTGDAANSYAIAIQAGAILAVLFLYPDRFTAMLRALVGRDAEGRKLLIALFAASVPAAVVGLALEDWIKQHLFGIWPVVAAWFVGGVAILVVAYRRRHRDPQAGAPVVDLTWRSALLIGFAQTLALWPGTSRSLVTILAATALGLSVPAAVEFSFLLGFIILSGATLYETISSGTVMVDAYGLTTPLLGLVVAFVSAFVAMRWMVAYLQSHGLQIFGYYRIGIALIVGVLLLTGIV